MAPIIAWSLPAEAREPRGTVDVTATTLPEAMAELSREAGVSIGAEGPLPRVRVNPVSGPMNVERALSRILARSGFRARRVGPTAWRIERVRATLSSTPLRPTQSARRVVSSAAPISAEIIVTGNKEMLSLGETPSAVAIVTADTLSGPVAARGSAAVAAELEGVALTGEGVGRNRMFLRGVADSVFAGRNQSTVAVLLGDSRLTWSAPDPDLRLVDVERVEVLKGPQGSLYGSGALGGIYRVVPRRADPTESAVVAGVSAESVAGGERGISGFGIVNLPLVADVAAVRLVAYGDLAPGWIDTGARSDANRTTALGLRATLGVEVRGGWRLDVGGMGQWLNSQDSGYVYVPRSRTRPNQAREPHDNDLLHGSLRLAREAGPVSLLLASGYTRQSVDDRYDATLGAEVYGLADPRRLDDDRTFKVWDNELRANGKLGRVRWLAGLSYVVATRRQMRSLTDGGGSTAIVGIDRQRSGEAAVYGQGTVPLGPNLDLSAGARMAHGSQRIARGTLDGEGMRAESRLSLTPSVKLAWRPRPGRLLYAGFDTAVREGGAVIEDDGSLGRLEGDELETVSAGWREGAGPLRFDLGIYRSRWSNVQSDVLRPGGLIETANVGDGSILGADLSVDADIAPGWRIAAGALAQSALLDATSALADPDDRRLPVVPRATARLALTRDFALGPWDLSATLRARHVGRGRLSFDPALDRPLGGYTDTGIALTAVRGSWHVGLSVTNLLDGRADVFAYGNPLRILTMPQHVAQDPRRFVLSIAWKPSAK